MSAQLWPRNPELHAFIDPEVSQKLNSEGVDPLLGPVQSLFVSQVHKEFWHEFEAHSPSSEQLCPILLREDGGIVGRRTGDNVGFAPFITTQNVVKIMGKKDIAIIASFFLLIC